MRTPLALATGLLALSLSAPSQQPGGDTLRDGERCPPARWYVEGGNAARNGATQNAPLLRRPVVAWTQKLSGTLLGEPLVWDQHVVVALRVSDKKRGVEVRRLSDGSLVGQRVLDSTATPSPCLWGNEVVWRSNADGLELLRIGEKSLDFVGRTPTTKGISAPLRFGMRLFAIANGHVICMRVADFRVLWRTSSNGFCGSLTLLDQCVYALQKADDGHRLVALDRSTGAARATTSPVELAAPPGDDACIQLAGTSGMVRFGNGHWLTNYVVKRGAELNAIRFVVPLAEGQPDPWSMPHVHALDGRRQIGTAVLDSGKHLWSLEPDGKSGVQLDTCELHRDIASVPPTLAGGVMYFGACAVDTTDFRILWRHGDPALPRGRAIPAGRHLVIGSGSQLTTLREDTPVDPVAAELDAVWVAAQRSQITPLIGQAVAAADWELADELLDRCRDLGADEAWATKTEKDLTTKSKDTKAKLDAGKAARIHTAFAAVSRSTLEEVYAGLASWSSRSAAERRQALRFVLGRAPDHPGCIADVRKMLSGDVAPPEPFLALDWLDFLDAIEHSPVAFLDAKLDDFRAQEIDAIVAQNKQQLLEWRHRWRPDLQALVGARTLLFSPITTPGSLAKALATGELVCDTLETMFADMPRVRHDARPMLVFIYPDRNEYIAESKKLGVESAESTAGYYSDSLNELVPKSRLFVPPDDAVFASVLPTLAHELTHQWLMDRCGGFQPDPIVSRVGPKGFWIVEGFASLVGQFEFDFVRRKVGFGTANLQDADLVVSAKEEQLIDWSRLTMLSRLDFQRMTMSSNETAIASTLHMGTAHRARRLTLFYSQSAMLCRYLYEAEDARHRKALLDYVAAYYTGAVDKLDFQTAFGVAADELGPKVVEYSRRILQ